MKIKVMLLLTALSALACVVPVQAANRKVAFTYKAESITEGWDVVVTYHFAEVQVGGGILWKQAQHHEPALSSDYGASRILAANYAKNGLWLDPNSGGEPSPPQRYLPAAAIHEVDLVYIYINVKRP